MTLLDLIWPRRCQVCGGAVDRPGRHICSECLMRVPFVPQVGCCRVCGRSVEALDTDFLCTDCSGEFKPQFDRAASAVRFDGLGRELVLDYKFHRALHLRDDLVDWMEGAARARFDVAAADVVVPMPITWWRRWDRGYNQCDYLARALAARIGRRCEPHALGRRGSPKRQSSLTEEERRENVRGSVVVRRPAWVRGRTVLLVDDIMTTGATLSESARVLKESGAARIWCVTLARSLRD